MLPGNCAGILYFGIMGQEAEIILDVVLSLAILVFQDKYLIKHLMMAFV